MSSSTDPADSPESVISLFSSWRVLTDVRDSRRDHWLIHIKRMKAGRCSLAKARRFTWCPLRNGMGMEMSL